MLPFSSPSSRSLRSIIASLVRRKKVWPILGVALAATLGFTGAARAHLGHRRAALDETFTFSPASGTHFSSSSLEVTTSVCDDSYGISSVSGSANGSGVAFNDGLIASCGGDPGNDKGTMDLTLVPGENDVEVVSCNLNSDCSFGFAFYYYDAPAMTVEASYNSISYQLPSDTMSFFVFNTGLVTDNVDWSVLCTGGVTCSGSGSFSLAYGSSHPTTVTVSGSTAGTGKVTFSAHYATYTGVTGSDTTHVVTTVPPPTVTAPSSPQSENPGTNVTLKFPVSVGAYGAGTYTLTPSCASFASCSVSPSSLTLSASSGDTARVSFHIPYLTANQDLAVGVTASGPATGNASTTVDVGAIAVASVFVGFDAPSVDIGQGTTAHATIVYADGSTLPNAAATWSTGNSGIATVNSSTGAVSGAGAGSTSITATVSGGSGSATIPVTTPPSVGIEVSMQRLNAEGSVSRDECLTIAAGDNAAYECGDLRLVHPLPSVKTMNESRAPMLIYNSRHSKPLTLVAANLTGFSVSPSTVTATLNIDGHSLSHTYSWNGSCNSATCRIVVPVPTDSLSIPTGWYADTLTVSLTSGGTPYSATAVGSVAIVDRTATPYGAGWWIDGIEQLVTVDATKQLWVAGDGNTRLNVATGVDSAYTPQTVIDRPDTLVHTSSGTWRRHLRNGAYVEFNSSGYQVRTVNREQDTTRFVYSGTALDSIVLPSPSGTKPAYTFSYATNGASLPVLQSVSSPGASGARTTTISRTGNWQLNQIEDPDGTNVYFTWDGNNRITRRKNRLGDSTTYTYDAAGGLTQAAIDMSRTGDSTIRNTFCAAETRTLVSCAGDGTGTTPLLLSSVVTRYDGPRTDSTDVTTFFINRFGAPDTVIDAHSNHTRVHRSLMFPALADSVIDPTSFKREAVYTARGLLQWAMSTAPYGGANDTTRYTYDDKWDQLSSAVTPTHEATYAIYDSTTGNRIWQQNGNGDSTRAYFWFNARNQVDSVRAPAHGGAQHFTYDPTLGNDSVVTTPMGYHTIIAHDAIGQQTTVRMQTDPDADTLPTIEHFRYDVMGRLRADSTVSTAFTYGSQFGFDTLRTVPSLTRLVLDSLDAEGNLLINTRVSLPDTSGTSQQTSYLYDAAHRRRVRTEQNSSTDSTWYDQAGNSIGHRAGGGKIVMQKYDALNRLTNRILPPDTTAQETCSGCTNNAAVVFAVFPYFATVLPGGSTNANLIIQGDTSTFTYDAAGRMASAINHDAQVWRSYYANGALHVERDSLRVYDPADTMAGTWGYHPFTLSYSYDLSGRRTAVDSATTQTYHYNALGMLDSTTGFDGAHHAFAYDAAGRLIHRATGTGVSESRAYDDDDRMTERSNNTYDDHYGHDARGKVTRALSSISTGYITSYSSDSADMVYDGFGALVLATGNRGAYTTTDEYTLDALGNVLQHDANRLYYAMGGRARENMSYLGGHLTYTASDPLASYRSGGGPLITSRTVTEPTFDGDGNQIASNTYAQAYDYTSGGVDVFLAAQTGQSFVRSYFDAADRMRVSQRAYFFRDPGSNARARTTFQEYFYDALGRRIAMRSQRDSTCTDESNPTAGWDCAQTMERFVWDGDQLLKELRDYGKWGEDRITLNENGYSTGAFFGMTSYTYALGLFGPDTPLSIYSGALGGVIVPQTSWRGTYEGGVGSDGSAVTAYSWPGQQTGLYLAPDQRQSTIVANRWIGSLVEGKVDGSGLVYDRNRYYDPSAGRFTQEDPAGLGGGLNLYGYASGDPLNNSDPFGLWPCPELCNGAVQTVAFAATMALSNPTVMRIQGGLQKVPEQIEAAVHAVENISDGFGVGTATSNTEDVAKNIALRTVIGESGASEIWTGAARATAAQTVTGALAKAVGSAIGFLIPTTMGDPEADPHWRERANSAKPKDP